MSTTDHTRQPAIRRWALWSAPPAARAFTLTVDLAALVLGGTTVALRTWWPGVALVVPLLVCAAIAIEGARRVERERRLSGSLHKDLQAAWSLCAALILPPGVAVLAVVAMSVYWRLRASRCRPFAWVFSGSMTVLAVLSSGAVFRLTGDALPDRVPHGLAVVVAVLAAALTYEAVDVLLCGILIVLLAPGATRAESFGDRTTVAVDAAALTFGGLVSIVALYEPWAMLLAVPAVVLLQRVLLVDQLTDEARTDAKTGLAVAGWWHQRASAELDRARARHTTFAVLVADLDHFKQINDAYGHLVGDEALRAVATAVASGVRGKDLAGRFGGEEFVLALPDTDADRAAMIADRLRERVAELRVPSRRDLPGAAPVRGLTVSIGVALYPDHADTLDSLLRVADTALYSAKAAGRNRIAVAGSPAAADSEAS
ncbi:GGDEF domain-containing protein [Actinocatenispora rupis]|uniref:GGDEF domain-containing protein n=1 Tax=Actinocatenispora rupis TaxID=519421 RepID=A0A8J3J4X3_9ACTN|nr:GGDEF domain-containing protein [Actinocatenispora rupis]GID15836.1 GGDEF domain-containing protein [Actinocatenispora rupis]